MYPHYECVSMDAHCGHAVPIPIQAIRPCDGFSGVLTRTVFCDMFIYTVEASRAGLC